MKLKTLFVNISTFIIFNVYFKHFQKLYFQWPKSSSWVYMLGFFFTFSTLLSNIPSLVTFHGICTISLSKWLQLKCNVFEMWDAFEKIATKITKTEALKTHNEKKLCPGKMLPCFDLHISVWGPKKGKKQWLKGQACMHTYRSKY